MKRNNETISREYETQKNEKKSRISNETQHKELLSDTETINIEEVWWCIARRKVNQTECVPTSTVEHQSQAKSNKNEKETE